MNTFRELQDIVLRYFDEVDDTDTMRALVKDAVRIAHNTRLAEEKWNFMLYPTDGVESLTLVPGQRVYTLHQLFSRPKYFYNRNVGKYLTEVTDKNFLLNTEQGGDPLDRFRDESPTEWSQRTGRYGDFVFGGVSPVRAQPASASLLTLESSSESEPSSNGLVVTGDTEDGVVEETLIINTPTSTSEFTRVISVRKIGTWSGTLRLKDADDNLLLSLFPSELSRKYQTIELLFTPTHADTVEYKFYRIPSRMVEDYDIPDIPEPYELVSAYDALIQMSSYNQVESNALRAWEDMRSRLDKGLRDKHLPQTIGAKHSFIQVSNGD